MNRIIFLLPLIIKPSFIFSERLRGIEGTTEEVRVADNITFLGLRAMGMGGAHIAAADDYSATYYNPANLSFITRIELSGAISNNGVKNESELNNIPASKNLTKMRIDYIGGILPLPVIQGGAALSCGYNVVNQFDRVLYAGDTTRKALERSSGALYALSFAGGVQVAKGLGVGATLEIYNGGENYSWDLEKYITPIPELQRLIISDNIKYDYKGVGVKLGLTYYPIPILKLGGVIHFPGTITINENGTQRTDSIFTARENYNETERAVETYKISLPFRFGAGISLDLLYLLLAADIDYTDWRQLEYKSPSWILQENKYFENSYRSTWRIRTGVEGTIPIVGIKLRAGFSKEPLPYVGKEVKDDRYTYTFGAGTLIAKLFAVDMALSFSGYSRLDKEANLFEKYRFQRLGLGLSYRF